MATIRSSKPRGKTSLLNRKNLLLLIIAISILHIWSIYYFFKSDSFIKSTSSLPSSASNAREFPSFVTVLMPSVVNPKDQAKRLKAIANTWGPAARAVFVVHDNSELHDFPTLSDISSAINHPSFPIILQIPPSIPEDQGVQRLQYVIRTISTVFQSSEFAFFVNDHTFVIPEKLGLFLSQLDPSQQIYAGHALKDKKNDFAFNSGAAGYVLSRTTIHNLLLKFDEKDPQCVPPSGNNWLNGNPGLVTAQCLYHALGVSTMDTRQSLDTESNQYGGHQFHAYGIVRTATADVDNWYRNKHEGFSSGKLGIAFSSGYDQSIVGGGACCSSNTISFHYVESYETLALYAIRKEIHEKQLLSQAQITDNELKKLIQQKWPDNDSNGWVGGYAKPLPKDTETQKWTMFLGGFRKILDFN